MNEKTAKTYADHLLFTANRNVMADINKIFRFLESPHKVGIELLDSCKQLMVCPNNMRNQILELIDKEIDAAQEKKEAHIIIKLNSLSDKTLIQKLYEAAIAGVKIEMVIRGIYCAFSEHKKFAKNITAVSIVDEYLEHARVFVFHNAGKQRMYISSADWMVRNMDYRIEVAVEIKNKLLKRELLDIINIQLADNVKARRLDNTLANQYVEPGKHLKVRSQLDIFSYLSSKQTE